MKNYEKILQFEAAPGPYSGVLSVDVFKIDGKPLSWKIYYLDPENKQDDSRIMLIDSENTPWLILNYGCYIKLIGESKVLIWYYTTDPRDYFVAYFDLSDLLPIDPEKAHKVLTSKIKSNPKDNPLNTVSCGFYAEFKNEPITFKIPNKLSEGKNSFKFPNRFKIEEEIILHGYYDIKTHVYGEDFEDPWGGPYCILLLQPYAQNIEISCVDWFNTGDFDVYYQWITRIARDPKTQKFMGEGFRMGIFQLDKTGKKLDKWLLEDEYYIYPLLNS
ncbi:MAG: hypothetical protein ACTSRE_01765 [Promethearchaeota archaeon]